MWSSDLEIGVPELDEQHKYFFDIANRIIDLQDKLNVTKAEILDAIGKLGGYSMDHFATEETMLNQLGEPAVEAHLAKHDKFRKEIKEFILSIEASDADDKQIASKVAEFACSYVNHHMLNARTENILKQLRELKK